MVKEHRVTVNYTADGAGKSSVTGVAIANKVEKLWKATEFWLYVAQ